MGILGIYLHNENVSRYIHIIDGFQVLHHQGQDSEGNLHM